MSELLHFLARGQAENLVCILQVLSPEERAQVLVPLKPLARLLAKALPQEESSHWCGPFTEEHLHAAEVVLFSAVSSLLRQVPSSHRFILESVPELYPDSLGQIFEAWGELYMKTTKNYDRAAAILQAVTWFDGRYDLSLPTSQGVGLVLLTGQFNLGRVYDVLMQQPVESRQLVKAVFQGESLKGLSVRQADENRPLAQTLRGFLLPALCRAGVLTSSEVEDWCEKALRSQKHSAFEKEWFRQVRDAIST